MRRNDMGIVWELTSASTIGPGGGGTSYLTDFDETWPVQRVPPKTTSV